MLLTNTNVNENSKMFISAFWASSYKSLFNEEYGRHDSFCHDLEWAN